MRDLGSNRAILPRILLIVFLCWPLAIWLSLVLGSLLVPGSSRLLELWVELVVPNGSRPLIVFGYISPPGKQVELIVPGGRLLRSQTGPG